MATSQFVTRDALLPDKSISKATDSTVNDDEVSPTRTTPSETSPAPTDDQKSKSVTTPKCGNRTAEASRPNHHIAAHEHHTAKEDVEASKGTDIRELGAYEPSDQVQSSRENAASLDDVATLLPPMKIFEKPNFVLKPVSEIPPECDILDHDVTLLHKANHADPFAVLGPRLVDTEAYGVVLTVRAWVKDSTSVGIAAVPKSEFVVENNQSDGVSVSMNHRADWLFQKAFTVHNAATNERLKVVDIGGKNPFLYELQITYIDGNVVPSRDPYSFGLDICSDFELQLFQSGSFRHVDHLMGSHVMTAFGATGVRFVVWAPNAVFVSVVGDWNAWDGRVHPMRHRHAYDVWDLFIPGLHAGLKYGYRIHSQEGMDFVKIDPYAQQFEVPPKHASIISGCDDAYKPPAERFKWTDDEWMKKRVQLGHDDLMRRQPMAIYEVHLPSWMRGDDNSYLGYRELADRLVQHCSNMNFTHVEFLPLAHHPFEGSWGYQTSGQYAPYSRLGTGDDLKYLINRLHEANIGVFLDYVPAHFCKDEWGLVHYDGKACYEYADEREGEHKLWGTKVFNFRRNEVRAFLLGAAYHWLRRYHIDGLRIDAVSSMLYKNHGRPAGDWLPNEFGGDANLQAISLLQELNWVVHKDFPGVFTMAEESTSWQGVTDREKGLGFDSKWDLGWMNDTLAYLCTPTPSRPTKHQKLTFRGLYLAHEKWVLPLSHDEVVSGKGSLLDKCGFKDSPYEERIKALRALFGFQIGMPGRPLIFMGCEFGQGREWKETRSVDWHEAAEPLRAQMCSWVSDLLGVYRYHPALHAGDDEGWNFQWTDCDNATDCIVAWIRKWGNWYNDIVCICNFSGTAYNRYPIGVPHGGEWEVLLNSDDWRYGGTMYGPGNLSRIHTTQGGRLGWAYCLWIDIAPFSCLYLKAPSPPTA